MITTYKRARKQHRSYKRMFSLENQSACMSLKQYIRTNRNMFTGATGKLLQVLS